MLDQARDLWESLRELEPHPVIRTAEWAREQIVNETGRPYDHAAYPHLAAPGGPFDAWDDPAVRVLALQWGVRLGKTFCGQCCNLSRADQQPGPTMFATSSQKLAKEAVEKLLDLVEKSRLTRLLGKDRRLQRSDLLTFKANKLYVAWSRSASTLADKNIQIGHANEIDKWEHSSTASEGDPLELFFDRFNDFTAVYKAIVESTPALKGKSRIERWRLQGSNCSFWVPCPHCKTYQVLVFGNRESRHGIKWDADKDGHSTPDLAEQTARYVCRHCFEPIRSSSRRWMFAHGVWAPEGCGVVAEIAMERALRFEREPFRGWASADWISGTPARSGSVASYHLPAWYALKIPEWGFFAKRFVRVARKRGALQTFVNQIAAETFEAAERRGTWEEVGRRVIDQTLGRGWVPAETVAIVLGIDKQFDRYVWVCDAFGPEGRVHTVAYGETTSLDDLERLMTARWPGIDGSAHRVAITLIDSGYRPREVYQFCAMAKRKGLRVLPCRGSSQPLQTFAVLRTLGDKTSAPGQRVVWIDMASTQDLIEAQLYSLKPGDAGAWTLHAGSLEEHADFLQQMLNDGPEQKAGEDNIVREKWVRRDEELSNDFRDARRYCGAAYQFRVRSGRRDQMLARRRKRRE